MIRSEQPIFTWNGFDTAYYYHYISVDEGAILNVEFETLNNYIVEFGGFQYYINKCDVEKINEQKVDDNINKIMNLKEKFVLAIMSEPQKSFRKAGITNGDDILTDEGTKIFLTWLLHHKFAEEFKKEIVDGILKEKETD